MIAPLQDIAQAGTDAKAEVKAAVAGARSTERSWIANNPHQARLISFVAGVVSAGALAIAFVLAVL